MKYFILVFSLLTANCIYGSTPEKILLNHDKQIKGELTLKDLVESIEYIPLEATDECLITVGMYQLFDVSDNYIVVGCYQSEAVYLFKRNGHFIKKISEKGAGPDEYLSLSNVAIDETRKHIVINDRYKMMLFSLSGKFLKAIKTPTNDDLLQLYYKDRFITGVPSGMMKDQDTCVFRLWDSNFNLINSGVKAIPVKPTLNTTRIAFTTFRYPFVSYLYENKFHVRETSLNETLYVVNDMDKIIPKYVIDEGKYKATVEMRADADYWSRVSNNGSILCITSIFETPSCLFMNYYKDRDCYCYYDKQQQKIFYLNSKEGIPDTIEHGIDFWPKKQKNNLLLRLYNAPELLELYEKQKGSSTTKGEKAVQKVKQVLRKLDVEDNPVLIIAKIKQK